MLRCPFSTLNGSLPGNGTRPVSISKTTAPEAVDIGSRVDGRRRQLLGRGVRDCSDEFVRPGQPGVRPRFPDIRQAEVHQLVDPLARREFVGDDVRWLQIAMDDAETVSKLQGPAERRHDAPHIVDREAT